MFYLIYQITNLTNGKIYIGKHKTNNIDDGYMGSGIIICRAIKKYGIENFKKEILFCFDNEDAMNQKEKEIVNEDFLKREDVYNLSEGGKGGDCKQALLVLKDLMKDEEFHSKWLEKHNIAVQKPENREKISEGLKLHYKTHNGPWLGRTHSEETKRKISETQKSRDISGESNPNYGNCWIIHPETEERKLIPKNELTKYEELGYLKGRNLNTCYKHTLTEEDKFISRQRGLEKRKITEDKKGKRFCYVNRYSGKRKFFRESELPFINLEEWKPTWSQYDVREVQMFLDNGYTWNKIAEYYGTTYWGVYSWFLENKEKFKVKKRKKNLCLVCGKEISSQRKKICSKECFDYYKHHFYWIRKGTVVSKCLDKNYEKYKKEGWLRVIPIGGKKATEWLLYKDGK